ncbi:MAG: hypothetical protein E2O68_00855 [Deltaproteobacteria bacterium]|nr:MAG: hypothetical protein E2O68_00855 [Deltaproteobacteria bacterium]
MSWNQVILNSVFGICCLYIILVSNLRDWNMKSNLTDPAKRKAASEKRESVLENSKIYHLKDNKPHIYLSSKLAKIQLNNNDTDMELIEGRSFKGAKKPVDFSAKKAFYRRIGNKLILVEEVVLIDDQTNLKADKVTYFFDQDEIIGRGNVLLKGKIPQSEDKIEIKAKSFSHYPGRKISTFQDDVKGVIHRPEKYREGLEFEADKLEYSQRGSKISLIGAVLLNKPPFTVSSRRGEIFLENYSNKLNYFVLNDDVKLREKRKNGLRKAFAEKMEGIASEGKLILTGLPKVIQDGETIKGNKITIRENSEVVEVDDAYTTFKINKGR